MRKYFGVVMACCAVLSLVMLGCGEKKADSSKDAIAKAQSMGTTEDKVDHLNKQARAFINAKQYKDAIATAEEALKLDDNSQEARSLLARAQKDLAASAQEAVKGAEGTVDEAKKSLGGLLKKSE